MPLRNTSTHYGGLTKTFHWLTALLILTAFPVGYFAHSAPFATGEELAFKATLFSLHKTIGLAAFFTALLRILWALSQKRPGLLNADHKLEATAAETAHWLLYSSMLLVPLSGWIHHATTEGFAPIWWPFGQNLPLVPKSESLAQITSGLHFVLMIVLALTILAHVGGALKHFVIDRDKTLQRMLPGTPDVPNLPDQSHGPRPFALALIIWVVALFIGSSQGYFTPTTTTTNTETLAAVQSDWQAQSGQITIEISQFGNPVSGSFEDWTAQISFDEDAVDGKHGSVEVVINIGSLTLGSVTQQAMGADYFNTAEFPTATFAADILPADEGYLAEGTLTLRGKTIPVTLPFYLEARQENATMSGEVTLNRQDFGIGDNQPDESSLGFSVLVLVELTATRQ